MAKGIKSKAIANETILKAFPGSFIYDKEVRIPFEEDGEQIQLKCVLTCAKTNVEQGGENAIPGSVDNEINFGSVTGQETTQTYIQPTEEEKENVKRLMDVLGL